MPVPPRSLVVGCVKPMTPGIHFFRGAEDGVFTTTHGVKQDCPLSCFLFVIVFEIPLCVLHQHGITFSAYVDDICSHAPCNRSQRHAGIIQETLSLIGCQLNVAKTESLCMSLLPPPLPLLPKYCHPSCPVQASSTSLWAVEPAPHALAWGTYVLHPFTRAKYLMHLGHPYPSASVLLRRCALSLTNCACN